MGAKIAIATLCDSKFLVGLRVMLFSLVSSNPWVRDIPIEVFWTDSEPVPERIHKLCQKLGLQVNWRYPDLSSYSGINVGTKDGEKCHGSYHKYEVFTLSEYDKVIFLDSDIFVCSDISELLRIDDGISAVKEIEIPQFNTGVLSIGKKFLNHDFRDALIAASADGNHSHVDQDVINSVVGSSYNQLPVWYNVLKSYFRHLGSWISRAKIIHYIADKPWHSEFSTRGNIECVVVERLWLNANALLDNFEAQGESA